MISRYTYMKKQHKKVISCSMIAELINVGKM